MDYLQDQILTQLPYYEQIKPILTTILPYITYAQRTLQYSTTSILLPFLKYAVAYLRHTDQNPLVVIAGLVVTLFLSLRVLGWLQRQIFGWIYLILQLALVVCVGVVGLAVWQFGAERCLSALLELVDLVQDGKTEGRKGMERHEREIRGAKW